MSMKSFLKDYKKNSSKMSRQQERSSGGNHKHDFYAYNPSYEWTSFKTNFGMFLSYGSIIFIIFYMGVTLRDYITLPPELVSQGDIDLLQVVKEFPFDIPRIGVRLSYTNASDPSDLIPALENENPFVRIYFKHVEMVDQVRVKETLLDVEDCIVSNRVSVCPIVNRTQHKLQGTFYKTHFHFLEISVDKCTNEKSNNTCAPLEVINEKIHSGDFRIRTQLNMEGEVFDVDNFHTTGVGFAINNRSFEYFGLPDIEVESDIFFKARKINKKSRFLGSPPLPKEEVNILTFGTRHTSYRPRTSKEVNVMYFTIRLDDNVALQEVSYWCPSLLTLFGLWGAMVSFIFRISLGFLATQYNKYHFHKQFDKAADLKRQEACIETQVAMDWIVQKKQKKDSAAENNNKDDADTVASNLTIASNRSHDAIYKNLQIQYDALMVAPDIRLFEPHHFNKVGRIVAMSAAELKYPSTAFGELRRLAIIEHGKKKRAAQFLSLWYGRHLVRKGFITDPERCRELFTTPFVSNLRLLVKKNQTMQKGQGTAKQRKGFQHLLSSRPLKSTTFDAV